jgi:glycogen operon protein
MLLGGDEIGRTQQGNNNGYCQDNEISWYDWGSVDEDLLEFTRRLIGFRRGHPVFRRRGWFQGEAVHGWGIEDIGWFTPEGAEMENEHWGEGYAKSMAVLLNGRAIRYLDPFGQRVQDDSFLVLFNAHTETLYFTPPAPERGVSWVRVFDTAEGGFLEDEKVVGPKDWVPVQGHSMALLRWFDSDE